MAAWNITDSAFAMRQFNRDLGGLLEEHRQLLRIARIADRLLTDIRAAELHAVFANETRLEEALKGVEDLL